MSSVPHRNRIVVVLCSAIFCLEVAGLTALGVKDGNPSHDGAKPAAGPATEHGPTVAVTPGPPKGPVRIIVGSIAKPGAKPAVRSVWLSAPAKLHTESLPRVPVKQISWAHSIVVSTEENVTRSSNPVYCDPYQPCFLETDYTESRIVISDLDGSNRRVITRDGYDTQPAFSPDGSMFAFLSHFERNATEYDAVAVMDWTGALRRRFIPPKNRTYDSFAWSPDSRRLALSERIPLTDDDHPRILVTTLDGNPKSVARGRYRSLAWSHDGTRIAAVRLASGLLGDVWVISVATGRANNVSRHNPRGVLNGQFCGTSGGVLSEVRDPVWSPDDTRVAYASNYRHLPQMGRVFDVEIARADGSRTRIVYESPRARCRGAIDQPLPPEIRVFGWL